MNLKEILITRNACLFGDGHNRLKVAKIRKIDGVDSVVSDEGFFKTASYFDIVVRGRKVRVNATYDQAKIDDTIQGCHGWVNRLHSIDPLDHVEEFHAYLNSVNKLYGVVAAEPFSIDSPEWQLLERMTHQLEGTLFIHDSFVDMDGHILLGKMLDLYAAVEEEKGYQQQI